MFIITGKIKDVVMLLTLMARAYGNMPINTGRRPDRVKVFDVKEKNGSERRIGV
jgi:hypothetical protein